MDPCVHLAAVDEKDWPLVERWLAAQHVREWWGPPDQVLKELKSHTREEMALICCDGQPTGLLAWQVPTRKELAEAGLEDLPEDLVDIDVMIGELDWVGKGRGQEALRQLFHRLRAEGVPLVGMAAEVANERSLRCITGLGLAPWRDFVEEGKPYRYFVLRLSA